MEKKQRQSEFVRLPSFFFILTFFLLILSLQTRSAFFVFTDRCRHHADSIVVAVAKEDKDVIRSRLVGLSTFTSKIGVLQSKMPSSLPRLHASSIRTTGLMHSPLLRISCGHRYHRWNSHEHFLCSFTSSRNSLRARFTAHTAEPASCDPRSCACSWHVVCEHG